MWGIDIIGSLPIARGGAKFAIVAVDYFTKWVEAEPLTTITTKRVINFIVRNIICRYGIPKIVITDNGTQFDSAEFRNFFQKYHIENRYTSVAHPQSNGQVEAANKVIKSILKRRMKRARAMWADELPLALWAYRTTYKSATGLTPFSLAFGTEAVIPIEIKVPSNRVTYYDPMSNNELLLDSLDMIEEKRDEADLRALRCKQQVARYYNKKVRARTLEPGDLVLKRVFPPPTHMGAKWEGPYSILSRLDNGTFKLATVDGKEIPRVWNAQNLRPYLT